MRRARRRVLRALACVVASLLSPGRAAPGPAASSPMPRSAASSPEAHPVFPQRLPALRTIPRPAAAPAQSPPPARSSLIGARSFLLTGRDEPTGFGAYGYLLL